MLAFYRREIEEGCSAMESAYVYRWLMQGGDDLRATRLTPTWSPRPWPSRS